ncbi:MAG TPA: queuosine precursor transporter, partial [Bacillota bacterium]|nr:queuosine precursor transporter [Bacillota bacterium]
MTQNNQLQCSPLFLILACFFVAALLLSNLIAGKLALFFGVTLPAAVVLFPLTYIFGDILTEVYGFKKARLIIWTGLGANLFMVGVLLIAVALPFPDFWHGQQAFAEVLGQTPRVVGASLLAYFCGEFFNSVVLARLKVLTQGRQLWLRAVVSTMVGEGVDTVVFIGVAFGGTVPLALVGNMMLAQY